MTAYEFISRDDTEENLITAMLDDLGPALRNVTWTSGGPPTTWTVDVDPTAVRIDLGFNGPVVVHL